MSLALLLEEYDVSTEEGLAKALSEIEKEEAEVDEALSSALLRACDLEGRLRTASQAYSRLGEIRNDAHSASDMVDKTAALAKDVSAKVRQLDLARSRVAECQRRVHDLIDLQLCSAGVEAAIKAHDYETGAGHVARFLSMDPGSVAAARARGAPDPRHAMTRAADTLREHLVRKFEEAARKDDAENVERLFKLFPQIGRAEEGVDLLAKYIAAQVSAGCARVLRDLERGRPLDPGNPKRAPASALAAEPMLVELAKAHNTILLYFAFLRRNVQMDGVDEKTKQTNQEAIEKIIAESGLMRTAQDLLGHYLKLERYFLEENVNKALKMATPQAGSTTSNLVDDIFFIARKSIRRSVTTGSVEGVCAVLNEAGALVERGAAALRRWLRPAPEPVRWPLPPNVAPAPALALAAPALPRLYKDADAQRELFLAHMNEAESGAEWSERLAAEACEWGSSLSGGEGARERLISCAGGLAGAAGAYRAALELAQSALRAALAPPAHAWAARLAAPARADPPEELEEDADALPQALDVLVEDLRASLSPRCADHVLTGLLNDLADTTEARILQNHYDMEGGIAVERRIRRLAAWAGSSAPGARERIARLKQGAALLALERPHHAAPAP
ncbi:hypothetical protein evm_000063 [Chilo suppressalis]|nr:hypothetical protein evm_000063 [Chilo suppressalis]